MDDLTRERYGPPPQREYRATHQPAPPSRVEPTAAPVVDELRLYAARRTTIARLHGEGVRAQAIADQVGVGLLTVRRHLRALRAVA